jgi:hypothetical protein
MTAGLDPITRVDVSAAVGFSLISTYADLLAALGSNKTIRIAPNTLIPVSATLSLDGFSNLHIEGAGLHSGLDMRGVNFRAFDARNTSKIGFHQLRFLGDYDTQTSSMAAQGAIVTDNPTSATFCSDLTLEGCYFDNLCGDGVRIGPNARGIKLLHNTMRGGLGFIELSGIDIGGDTRPVSAVLIDGNQVYASLTGGRAITLSGSDDLIDCFGGTNDLTISNNFLDMGGNSSTTSTNCRGIIFVPVSTSGVIRKADIHNNTFRRFNSTAVAAPDQSAILLAADSWTAGFRDLNVHDNLIDDCHFGIRYANATASIGVTIHDNVVTACMRNIDINNSHDVCVYDNVLRYPTDIGMWLQGDRLSVRGNRMFLDSTLTGNKSGIYCAAGDDYLISENYISGGPASSFSLNVTAGNRYRIFDNVILNNTGTGMIIANGAANMQLRDNVLTGNGTDLTNNDTTTVFRKSARKTYTGVVGTTTIDLALGDVFEFTFGAGNETLALNNIMNAELIGLTVIQDGVGSRTMTWPGTIKWAAGTAPTLTTAANARDVFQFYSNGTNLYERSRALDVR